MKMGETRDNTEAATATAGGGCTNARDDTRKRAVLVEGGRRRRGAGPVFWVMFGFARSVVGCLVH